MWIHFPGWPSKKYKQVNVKPSDNFWVHFRKREGSDEPFKYQMSSFFSANGALEIEKNFRDFVDKHAKLQYGMLTRKAYYYAEFEKCYREIFYDRETMADFCPTSLRCNISSVPGLQCTVAATKYEWKRLETDLVVHYPVEAGGYEIRENGC
ncbi:Protein F59C6.8 [Aphelenchoides avenae]|nr:Protein F59C6.8 [Aphelenchus avenae]